MELVQNDRAMWCGVNGTLTESSVENEPTYFRERNYLKHSRKTKWLPGYETQLKIGIAQGSDLPNGAVSKSALTVIRGMTSKTLGVFAVDLGYSIEREIRRTVLLKDFDYSRSSPVWTWGHIAVDRPVVGMPVLDETAQSLVDEIESKESLAYEPGILAISTYLSFFRRANGGVLRSILVGARIPKHVAQGQIRSAVLGALEAMFIEYQEMKGQALVLSPAQHKQLRSSIAFRLGNLTTPDALAVGAVCLEELSSELAGRKLVVNGGILILNSLGRYVAVPKARIQISTLLKMHTDNQLKAAF